MHRKLSTLFDDLETQRVNLLEQVLAIPDQDFHRPRQPGKWSAAQILMHLVLAERMSLIYMKKKSLGVQTLSDSGMMESAKLIILKISQRVPFKYKAPNILLESMQASLSLDEIKAQWTKARTDLNKFLAGIEDRDLRKKIYKHPVVGMLDVMQALQFYKEHVRHHRPQIEYVIKRIKQPS